MDRNTQRGFTLIELLVALAIAGILLGIGVPSFMEAIRNSRMTSDYNEFVGALYLARSEAIKGSDNVTVCARENDTKCGTDWTNGLIVFADSAGFNEASAQVADAVDILRIVEPLGVDDFVVIAEASANRTEAGMSGRDFIRYGSEGASNWATGTIQLCDKSDIQARARAINIVITGDMRPGRPASETSDIPMNVFNKPIACE